MIPAKALIVEPEQNQRAMLCQTLSAWGLRAEAAEDGVEAVTKFIAWAPQVVITDLKLSKLDGFELLERISSEHHPSAVVVLTAQASIEQAVKAVRLGAFDFLEKPVNTTRLHAVVEAALRHLHTSSARNPVEPNQHTPVKRLHMVGARASDRRMVEMEVGRTTVEQAERMLILGTLDVVGQNKTRAAEVLGISLKTLHNKLNRYTSSQ